MNPAQPYGHQAVGASRLMVDEMRRNMKKSSHLGRTASCVSTTIKWVHGDSADPFVELRLQQAEEWLYLWTAADVHTRRGIRRYWRQVMPDLVRDPLGWRRAHGPIAGTFHVLIDAGWKPAAAVRWRSPRGTWHLWASRLMPTASSRTSCGRT